MAEWRGVFRPHQTDAYWTIAQTAAESILVMALSGILNVNKPAGCSSRDVVDRVERLVRPSKAGHAGTLDPLAIGVLVICVGQATRLVQYVQRMTKRYRATFQLGRRSHTDDIEAEVATLANPPVPSRAAIDDVLPQFTGPICQQPPAYSAIKVAGQRAYKLARQGTPIELPARSVMIHALRVERYAYPELELEIACGSGTYVRALGRDLAVSLGTAAVMSALTRTAVGGFRVEDAVPVHRLTAETLPEHLQPPLTAVAQLPQITLRDEQLAPIRDGQPIEASDSGANRDVTDGPPVIQTGEWAAIDSRGQLVAILREKHRGQLWPACNLR